ncbi:hypothetical protein [Amycolatopsis sp. NBC_01480]|uniref:hypothetical protein n=1 Tax=Amycolatopsis sp. NBC_01480 TaxID=2903562 RepID=UPI002E280656|nr:hypothetical protein [Amycolatopsis sp. NBC_01480]
MTHATTPKEPAAADGKEGAAHLSAAEHCAAAETLFARARTLDPDPGRTPPLAAEYERCLEWACLHLRLAEAITAGAALIAAHRRLLADPEVRTSPHLEDEVRHWAGFFRTQHDTTRRTA